MTWRSCSVSSDLLHVLTRYEFGKTQSLGLLQRQPSFCVSGVVDTAEIVDTEPKAVVLPLLAGQPQQQDPQGCSCWQRLP